jgi:hypothetical protein
MAELFRCRFEVSIGLDEYSTPGVSPKPFGDIPNSDITSVSDRAAELQLVDAFLRISEKGGSDVRLDIGVPFRAGAWPRATARPHLWSWEIVHGYPWKGDEEAHINKLEALAVVNTVKWRLRNKAQLRSRFVHLVDSQVCGAIFAKGRTGSRALRTTVQRYNCLLLAGQLYPSYIYINSEDNPADLPSRWRWLKRYRAVKSKFKLKGKFKHGLLP